MTENTRIVLASRPHGAPTTGDFRFETDPVPSPAEGQVLLRIRYLSLDPYMRGRMSDAPSYAEPVPVGGTMVGATVGEVIESKAAGLDVGDHVLSYSGWQQYAVEDARGVRKLDADTPLSTALGVLGMPGFTAYAGLEKIGKPRPGETLVVAAATGPVGATVGQIAKARGARAVGIAGGPRKTAALLDEFGFDAAIDHRAPDFAEQLREACPDGIDVYFENVGGAVLRAVLPLLNEFARIPVCGLVAQYNATSAPEGPDRLPGFVNQVLVKSLTVRGFIQREFVDELYPQFLAEMRAWVRDGTVRYREHVVDGLTSAPEAFIGLLEGTNFGKLVVEVGAARS
ncbi:NADP-dependent oxidoreductase [Rhodococcus rhodnii]|uniref:NADPH:quinone reductase n=2 Tax=Rhodococcus rhodnii TaxID=38312 RepID=R7WLC6_9NOCA|nr:NADP-dependent oxidoreductase [Rhodococcus rhodnii]EOM76121.1 NADPH:quinone reductase [Rhodococcus rhodnii LMG 5362]TXG91778.1 NADP-dependent oxidoreductase [Rhodococcus rhodnii]